MQFYTEILHNGEVVSDRIQSVSDLAAARWDSLLLLTEIIRIGLDGLGRTVSARIIDENHRLVTTMSLTLDIGS